MTTRAAYGKKQSLSICCQSSARIVFVFCVRFMLYVSVCVGIDASCCCVRLFTWCLRRMAPSCFTARTRTLRDTKASSMHVILTVPRHRCVFQIICCGLLVSSVLCQIICCGLLVSSVLFQIICCGLLMSSVLFQIICCGLLMSSVLFQIICCGLLVSSVLFQIICCGLLVSSVLIISPLAIIMHSCRLRSSVPCQIICCGLLVSSVLFQIICCGLLMSSVLFQIICCGLLMSSVLFQIICCGLLVSSVLFQIICCGLLVSSVLIISPLAIIMHSCRLRSSVKLLSVRPLDGQSRGPGFRVHVHLLPFQNLGNFIHPTCLCLSGEMLKAVVPFC